MRTIVVLLLGVLSAVLATVMIYGLWYAVAFNEPGLPPADLGWSKLIGIGLAVRGVLVRWVD